MDHEKSPLVTAVVPVYNHEKYVAESIRSHSMILSIIIPSYNHKDFVLKTLGAALAIPIEEKEIIIIDDGSSDDSPRVIRDFIKHEKVDGKATLIARENRGLVKTLNEGLAMAQGKYLYGVASDDIPIPEGITSLVGKLEKDSGMQFAMGNALILTSEGQRTFRCTYGGIHRRFFSLPIEQRRRELFLHYPQPLLLQTTVFRSSALVAMNGWREDLISDDFALFLRLFSRLEEGGTEFGFYPEIMACFYRVHATNISKNVSRQFMTIDQTLTEPCPHELLDAAYFQNFVAQVNVALMSGEKSQILPILRSTIARIGLGRMINVAALEVVSSLTVGLSRHIARRHSSTIEHEPPVFGPPD